MRFARCKVTNIYNYMAEEGRKASVLVYTTVEREEAKFSNFDKTCTKVALGFDPGLDLGFDFGNEDI